MSPDVTTAVREGLAKLGVRRLLLGIHDVSFPSDADEDLGRGAPTTRAAARLIGYARDLGFTGIQLGPQGQTSRGNPSPYDGTVFSRNVANIGVAALRRGGTLEGLVGEDELDRWLVVGGAARQAHAYDASHALLDAAYSALERGARPDLRAQLDEFLAEHGVGVGRASAVPRAGRQPGESGAPATVRSAWLESDALYAALCAIHGDGGHRTWPARDRDLWLAGGAARRAELRETHRRSIARHAFGQLLVALQHARLRAGSPLPLHGDFQVGYSDADDWRHATAFLRGYRLGAPPSRTNPAGQPWEYPVLDPAQYSGAAGALFVARAEKIFAEYDGVRVDHPHGIVCPWVYRGGASDRESAVRAGARLFASPDLADHPALAPYSIARPEQIDRAVPRYHERWERELDDEQIARYATLLDLLIDTATRFGRGRDYLSCEVLSTMPTPLARVLARHGLGRWRVTQKANLDDPGDVYRTETAAREDWLMLGNHDTAPIFAVIRDWAPARREQWARHLAARLHIARPARFTSPRFFASAMLAELFVSRAENVSIFFGDLFGFDEPFNRPGVVDPRNWTLRLPHDFERLHAAGLAREQALDVPLAVDIALGATAA